MKKLLIALTLVVAFSAHAEHKYLGNLSANPYDTDSASNPYGKYGSKYSPDSVNNPYGTYGSKYSNQSANNPSATDAPIIVNYGNGSPKIYGADDTSSDNSCLYNSKCVTGYER